MTQANANLHNHIEIMDHQILVHARWLWEQVQTDQGLTAWVVTYVTAAEGVFEEEVWGPPEDAWITVGLALRMLRFLDDPEGLRQQLSDLMAVRTLSA